MCTSTALLKLSSSKMSTLLSTILQHFTCTMKPSDPLLLANVTLRYGMYSAGKVDIS